MLTLLAWDNYKYDAHTNTRFDNFIINVPLRKK